MKIYLWLFGAFLALEVALIFSGSHNPYFYYPLIAAQEIGSEIGAITRRDSFAYVLVALASAASLCALAPSVLLIIFLHKTAPRRKIILVGALLAVHLPVGVLLAARIYDKRVEVPEFSIAVKLSQPAADRLHSLNESIVVAAYLDGDALPGQGRNNDPFRGVFLGSDEKLVDETNVARFARTKVHFSDWKRLSDKNYFVTINVFSARKAVSNNILGCDDPIDHINGFKGKIIVVHCSLIGEPQS
jgi:hypothetical protein